MTKKSAVKKCLCVIFPNAPKSIIPPTPALFFRNEPESHIFYDVHIFYYLWYGSPSMDNQYIHWDHPLVPHWDPKIAASHAQGRHTPPEDIASSFYPELGPYSSRDPKVLESHMAQIEAAASGKTLHGFLRGSVRFLAELTVLLKSSAVEYVSKTIYASSPWIFRMLCQKSDGFLSSEKQDPVETSGSNLIQVLPPTEEANRDNSFVPWVVIYSTNTNIKIPFGFIANISTDGWRLDFFFPAILS
uniref:Uncharacterized protein n=1 Tax=Xiphophorus couchianus TaxID=32473 RepID=A0A3B5KZM3_9TELE